MIRKLLVIFFSLLLLIFVSIVNAQTSTTNNSQTATDAASRLKEQMRLVKDQKRVELKQQIKDTVAAKREAVKNTVAVRKEEFKAKLAIIKDKRKKALVERIDAKLTNTNIKHTDRFTQVLSNLQIILDKISEDADKTVAQSAIDAAKAAVETQAAKTYTITISAENSLKPDVGAVTSQLRQDLMITHKLVVDAKQAVQALRAN